MADHVSVPTTPKRKREDDGEVEEKALLHEEEEKSTSASDGKEEGSIIDGPNPVEKIPFDFDSDDEDYIPDDGKKADRQVWFNYFKQVKESEGFDIEDFPGVCLMTDIVPLYWFRESPSFYEEIIELAKMAITKYNVDHEEAYEFVDIEKVNSSVVAGIIYYITFQVKNYKASDDGGGDEVPVEIFQAEVWHGVMNNNEVIRCRPKPTKASN